MRFLPTSFLPTKYLALGLTLSIVGSIWLPAVRAASPTNELQQKEKQQAEQTGFSGLLVILAARFKVKPAGRDEFLRLATVALQNTVKEPGVVSYSLYEDPNEKNSFIFFEQWKSRQSLDAHLATDYTKRLLERFPSFVDGEPSIKVYRVQSIDFKL